MRRFHSFKWTSATRPGPAGDRKELQGPAVPGASRQAVGAAHGECHRYILNESTYHDAYRPIIYIYLHMCVRAYILQLVIYIYNFIH